MYNPSKNRNRLFYLLLLQARSKLHGRLNQKKLAALLLLARFAQVSALIRRRSSYRFFLRRHLLPSPRHNTPWVKIRNSFDDQAYLLKTGLTVATFQYILRNGFERLWNAHTIYRDDVNQYGQPRLRRRSLPADGALGLVLHWITSTAKESELAEMFALVPSVLSRYLYFGLQILVHVLQHLPESQITWPSPAEMARSAELIRTRHPTVRGAFGFIDGLSLAAETSSDPRQQEATYNGWLHSHRIGNILVFAPDGRVIACKLNAPGSWHDARIARHIYSKLVHNTPNGFFLIGDTAFQSDTLADKIHTPLKEGNELPVNRCERAAVIEYSNKLTQARQAVEWGMRSLQSVFNRLRVPLDIHDPIGRQRLLEACVRLHNLRAVCMGINEIRSVYARRRNAPEVLRDHAHRALFPNTRNHDRIGRFYLQEHDP
ncbi:DDE superfamily endonuclease [Ceratobasidium sp. AG-Ba]|nr:DDE superfamily endonuclease [Ceratobasidium sp. AG-Ba]QRV96997.1 DDE superfamily endonuclease [Ceratobasidium sp. AG-Ba]